MRVPLGLSRKKVIGTLLALSCFALGLTAPLDILPPQAQRALGLVLLAIFLWTAEPLPLEYSSLVVLLLLPALGLLSFQESFSPFAATTIWLLFAGMVLSLGATETGADKRLAAFCQTHLCRRPLYLLLNLHLIGLLTALLIPSGMVRVLILLPLGFLLGGVTLHDGDPGLGVLLVPPGGLLLLVALLLTARGATRLR